MSAMNRKMFSNRGARNKLASMGGILSSSPELMGATQRFQDGGTTFARKEPDSPRLSDSMPKPVATIGNRSFFLSEDGRSLVDIEGRVVRDPSILRAIMQKTMPAPAPEGRDFQPTNMMATELNTPAVMDALNAPAPAPAPEGRSFQPTNMMATELNTPAIRNELNAPAPESGILASTEGRNYQPTDMMATELNTPAIRNELNAPVIDERSAAIAEARALLSDEALARIDSGNFTEIPSPLSEGGSYQPTDMMATELNTPAIRNELNAPVIDERSAAIAEARALLSDEALARIDSGNFTEIPIPLSEGGSYRPTNMMATELNTPAIRNELNASEQAVSPAPDKPTEDLGFIIPDRFPDSPRLSEGSFQQGDALDQLIKEAGTREALAEDVPNTVPDIDPATMGQMTDRFTNKNAGPPNTVPDIDPATMDQITDKFTNKNAGPPTVGVDDFSPEVVSPEVVGATDDARAARGFGRSAYLSDGTEPPLYDSGMIGRPDPEAPVLPSERAKEAADLMSQLEDPNLSDNMRAAIEARLSQLDSNYALTETMTNNNDFINDSVDATFAGRAGNFISRFNPVTGAGLKDRSDEAKKRLDEDFVLDTEFENLRGLGPSTATDNERAARTNSSDPIVAPAVVDPAVVDPAAVAPPVVEPPAVGTKVDAATFSPKKLIDDIKTNPGKAGSSTSTTLLEAGGVDTTGMSIKERTVAMKGMLNDLMGSTEADEKEEFWMNMAMVGFGIAAGQSPDAMKNIADGLLTGTAQITKGKADKKARDDKFTLTAFGEVLADERAAEAFGRDVTLAQIRASSSAGGKFGTVKHPLTQTYMLADTLWQDGSGSYKTYEEAFAVAKAQVGQNYASSSTEKSNAPVTGSHEERSAAAKAAGLKEYIGPDGYTYIVGGEG